MRMFGLKFRSLKLNISKLKWYFRWCFFVVGVDRLVSTFPQLFRRTLVHMFESQDLDCVFMEAHIYPRKQKHMVLECIPLPRELGDMAPIYFKVFMWKLNIYVNIYDGALNNLLIIFRKLSWSVMRNGPWIRRLWTSRQKTSANLYVLFVILKKKKKKIGIVLKISLQPPYIHPC